MTCTTDGEGKAVISAEPVSVVQLRGYGVRDYG